jgi:FKBP-type peptidyl-prolyl cis-trans isomerase SlyD
MTNSSISIVDGVVVSFDYTLRLADGEILDSSDELGPLVILQGYDEIIPGLGDALYGMTVGDEKDVTVELAAGYGERDDTAYEVVSLDLFPPDVDLEIGMEMELYDQENEQEFLVWVDEINDENVVLDFNHPLAGVTLYFHVNVVALRMATEDELALGLVHGYNHHHHLYIKKRHERRHP